MRRFSPAFLAFGLVQDGDLLEISAEKGIWGERLKREVSERGGLEGPDLEHVQQQQELPSVKRLHRAVHFIYITFFTQNNSKRGVIPEAEAETFRH